MVTHHAPTVIAFGVADRIGCIDPLDPLPLRPSAVATLAPWALGSVRYRRIACIACIACTAEERQAYCRVCAKPGFVGNRNDHELRGWVESAQKSLRNDPFAGAVRAPFFCVELRANACRALA